MKRQEVLAFLEDPAGFSHGAPDIDVWQNAFLLVRDAIAEAGSFILRPEQARAWQEMSNERVGLLLGPPGTGKTFVLAWMVIGYIAECRRLNKPAKVLVSAFTRGAIVNVLEAVAVHGKTLLGSQVGIRFIGWGDGLELPQDVEHLEPPDAQLAVDGDFVILGATTWTLARMLNRKTFDESKDRWSADAFDLIALDEASQMPVGQALMPLAGLSERGRLVAAGDNRQLGPIGATFDWELDTQALSGSLYDFLVRAGVRESRLEETFRLNAPLSAYPARYEYQGAYRSARSVADRRLPLTEGWRSNLPDWLVAALEPEYPVVVFLYDGEQASTSNRLEATWLAQLTNAYFERRVDLGVEAPRFWEEQLAIVSPHRAQNAMIRREFAHGPLSEGIVVETVEKIQGRERDAVFVSYTVSDPEYAALEAGFLYDRARFNVALTRARSKVVILLSRSLLEVVSSDNETFEQINALRQFVYGCERLAETTVRAGAFDDITVDIRVRSFNETPPYLNPWSDEAPDDHALLVRPTLPLLTDQLRRLDYVIRYCSEQQPRFPDVALWASELQARYSRQPSFEEVHELMRLGHIRLNQRERKRDGGIFWTATPIPLDEISPPFPCALDVMRVRLPRFIHEVESIGLAPMIWRLKHYFVWVDLEGRDVFSPLLELLEQEGLLERRGDKLEWTGVAKEKTPLAPPSEGLSDGDFAWLNALEDREVRLINFGLFESWSDASALARELDVNTGDMHRAMERLSLHGYVLQAPESPGRVRSRMAEMARELRYIKQRFGKRPIDRSPYLVRSLKVLAVNRTKPVRDVPLDPVFDRLKVALQDISHSSAVLDAMALLLRKRWLGDDATGPICVSGFQARSIERLVLTWFGQEDKDAVVITADTGAGKTEASCLPLIVGAAIEALGGVGGTRAVIVYPRIRLAINQAQRLVSYLAALAKEPGMPLLTLGVQNSQIPSSFNYERKQQAQEDRVWRLAPGGNVYDWIFPLFKCPSCETGQLHLYELADQPADRLLCHGDSHGEPCGWSFDGWVGSKRKIKDHPPHLFLPVTESLHQWMQDSRYSKLFGDVNEEGASTNIRAVLADEIHLYSLVAGAQVGYALQRLIARAEVNAGPGRRPMAVGMSATLGDPATMWASLIGRVGAEVHHVAPHDTERSESVRGREYYFFVQPEVESRGKDIAGASTTIQALMCLAHNMRRRTGDDGGFRGIAFLDSLDKLKRLHDDFRDAEQYRRLAALRTQHQFTHDEDAAEEGCCQNPAGCARFRHGECWYFAANDKHQWHVQGRYTPGDHLVVGREPIFSGSRGNPDEIVNQSDIVFATSSLEVGFDDPDMTLVYQHYAPANLASFVQRKGRGGRGAEDRPVTGVTLSVYSPRDSWYFRRPAIMLDAAEFLVPLNMENYHVRKGQVLSAFVDFLARYKTQTGMPLQPRQFSGRLFHEASDWICSIFGAGIFQELEVAGLEELWTHVLEDLGNVDLNRGLQDHPDEHGNRWKRVIPRDWHRDIQEMPSLLFAPINLPTLDVVLPSGYVSREDVTLGFAECAPGRMTRRWDHSKVHWNPYRGELAPLWETTNPREEVAFFSLDPGREKTSDIASLLPASAVRLLQSKLPDHDASNLAIPNVVYRPKRLPVEEAGRFEYNDWKPALEWNPDERKVQPIQEDSGRATVYHKSQGRLLGTMVAVCSDDKAHVIQLPFLKSLNEGSQLLLFRTEKHDRRFTGLRVSHVFWGSDVELVLETGKFGHRNKVYQRQLFWSEKAEKPLLFGYGMETEGVCLDLSGTLLNDFVSTTVENLAADSSRFEWHRSQYFRFLLITEFSLLSMTYFEASYLADLLVAMVAHKGEIYEQVKKVLAPQVLDVERFGQALKKIHSLLLQSHPTLTARRVADLAEKLHEFKGLRQAILQASSTSRDDAGWENYLRSVVLHSLGIRLKHQFVLHGHGDERKTLMHVALPIEMGEQATDRLTVCEKGSSGDGTTRTFIQNANEAFAQWEQDGPVDCPNARIDLLVEQVFSDGLDMWDDIDLSSPGAMASLAARLGLDLERDSSAVQQIRRLLFDVIVVGGQRFSLRDMYEEIRGVRAQLRGEWGREPDTWELVSAVVSRATNREETGLTTWKELGALYRDQDTELQEDSLAPESRLADQVYRLSARLCPDGCLACLHHGSDVVTDALVPTTTSRMLLQEFWAFASARAVGEEESVSDSPREQISEYLDPKWQMLLAELKRHKDIAIHPGGDIVGSAGRVLGTTLLSAVSGDCVVHVLAHNADGAVQTAQWFETQDIRFVVLAPGDGIGRIIDIFAEAEKAS